MRKFLYNITSGDPKSLIPVSIWATLESLLRLIPAVLAFYGIKEFFISYTQNRPIDMNLFLILTIIGIIWLLLQLVVSSIVYDKEFLAAYNVSAQGRTHLANHLRSLSLGYLDSRDPGDLTVMMLGDYALLETAISHMIPQAISALLLLVIAFVSLCFLNWKMTLSLYAMLPVALVLIQLSNKLMVKLGGKHIQAKVDSASRLQEYIQGIKEIKAYGLGGESFTRIQTSFDTLRNESIRLEGILGPVVMTSIAILRMGLPLLIFTGTYLLIGGSVTDLIFLAFVVVASRIYDPFTTLMMNYTEMKYSLISAERIMEIRNQPSVSGNETNIENTQIVFKDVSFAYDNKPVLHNIEMTLKPKTLTALVGPSGSGKSTLIKLIARFYDVNDGTITVGNNDIKTINPETLYDNLSFVFQDVYLFKDSIINNIKVGNQNASYEEIVEAAKKAQCHEFIMNLPRGYETMVGEGGSTLSGGEKQRISIARAFLKKSEIILLDEATAALDLENEAKVQKAISELVKDKTVVVIAHRLNTIRSADRIVVLDQGSIVGNGTHDTLIETCELYKNLVSMQLESKNWMFTR